VLFTRGRGKRIHYYNVEESIIFHQEYEDDPILNAFGILIVEDSCTPFYEYRGKWYFYHFVDNVTYEVGMDSLTKAYTLDFGRYTYNPKNLKSSNINFQFGTTFPYVINLQGQNNRYVMARIGIRNRPYILLVYDKSTAESKCIESFIESVDFLPRKVTNEYVLSWCTHGALEKYVNQEMLDESNSLKFRDLINSKEEENPIIIKYYFK